MECSTVHKQPNYSRIGYHLSITVMLALLLFKGKPFRLSSSVIFVQILLRQSLLAENYLK